MKTRPNCLKFWHKFKFLKLNQQQVDMHGTLRGTKLPYNCFLIYHTYLARHRDSLPLTLYPKVSCLLACVHHPQSNWSRYGGHAWHGSSVTTLIILITCRCIQWCCRIHTCEHYLSNDEQEYLLSPTPLVLISL